MKTPTPNAPARSCCSTDCCGGDQKRAQSPAPASTTTAPTAPTADIRETVREGYGKIARTGQWSSVKSEATDAAPCACEPECTCGPDCACGPGCTCNTTGGGCCGPTTLTPDQVASAIGYAQTDLSQVPEGANMGLSCGNPTAIASLKPGEVVLDLGSGGGFDCFIAGPKVGPRGRVIGIDMTPDMLAKARKNLAPYRDHSGLDNVEFRLGEIEHLPVPDASVDVVISNCVINLSPDKPQVWREIARVLKPGGRVAISDLALLRPLPELVRTDLEALIGCIAGASLVDDIRRMAHEAGLTDILLNSKPGYIEAMTDWRDPLYQRIVARLPAGTKASDFITSLDISALKNS